MSLMRTDCQKIFLEGKKMSNIYKKKKKIILSYDKNIYYRTKIMEPFFIWRP